MPFLKLQTNAAVPEDSREDLLLKASRTTAEALGKPERYVMVALEDRVPMSFAGDTAPLAYLELKSIGLPRERTREPSATLCALVEEALGIPRERVYIEFADAPRPLWGWNGATF
jgi:phenylpyruvate tautomerase PptA (4-oxalocrotonate tautomerase family)